MSIMEDMKDIGLQTGNPMSAVWPGIREHLPDISEIHDPPHVLKVP
jgi:hypothetical protein